MADRCRHIGSSSPLLCPRPQGEGVPWGFCIYLPQLTHKPRYRRFHIWWHAILTTSFSLISGGKPCQEHYNTNTNSPTAPEYQRLLPIHTTCCQETPLVEVPPRLPRHPAIATISSSDPRPPTPCLLYYLVLTTVAFSTLQMKSLKIYSHTIRRFLANFRYHNNID